MTNYVFRVCFPMIIVTCIKKKLISNHVASFRDNQTECVQHYIIYFKMSWSIISIFFSFMQLGFFSCNHFMIIAVHQIVNWNKSQLRDLAQRLSWIELLVVSFTLQVFLIFTLHLINFFLIFKLQRILYDSIFLEAENQQLIRMTQEVCTFHLQFLTPSQLLVFFTVGNRVILVNVSSIVEKVMQELYLLVTIVWLISN